MKQSRRYWIIDVRKQMNKGNKYEQNVCSLKWRILVEECA